MDINSFITFTLNTGALFERQLIYKEKNSNNEFKTVVQMKTTVFSIENIYFFN